MHLCIEYNVVPTAPSPWFSERNVSTMNKKECARGGCCKPDRDQGAELDTQRELGRLSRDNFIQLPTCVLTHVRVRDHVVYSFAVFTM